MSLIPQQDPTVLAIYDGIVKDHKESRRQYLGASSIGASCSRQLWFGLRWVKTEKFDGRQLNLFKTGHESEQRFVDDLRNADITVHDVDPETGKQFAISYHGGHLRGHADSIALGIKTQPDFWHLLEYKTHSEKSFKLLQKDGMQKSKPMHYAQMQVYMNGMELMFGYYLAKNKNTDELYGEVVHYNPEAAQTYIDRAKTIIFDSEPSTRVSDNPSWYECKWCNYSDYCHGTGADLPPELPDVNCRTCIHSTPQETGGWVCEYYSNEPEPIDYEQQVAACERHRFIPNLFPDLKFDRLDNVMMGQKDYELDESVFYRSRDGEVYNNSAKGVMERSE